jgi:hypothetical protein
MHGKCWATAGKCFSDPKFFSRGYDPFLKSGRGYNFQEQYIRSNSFSVCFGIFPKLEKWVTSQGWMWNLEAIAKMTRVLCKHASKVAIYEAVCTIRPSINCLGGLVLVTGLRTRKDNHKYRRSRMIK